MNYRRLFASIIALVVLVTLAFPIHGHFTTPYQVETRFYYNGCPNTWTAVGWRAYHCGSGYSGSGTQDGHWKEVEVENCYAGPGTPPTGHDHWHYYEKCNGAWVEVSYEDFSTGNCSCS